MGVSRISIRSALQRLHQEGLVKLEPHRGAKVTVVTLEDALQIMEVREGVEGWAASLAAERITPDALAEMESTLARLELVVREGRLDEFADVDGALHRKIIAAAENPRLQPLIDSLKLSVVRYRFSIILIPGRGEQSIQEHTEIMSALRSHSPGRAEAAMRHHIVQIRKNMLLLQKMMLVKPQNG